MDDIINEMYDSFKSDDQIRKLYHDLFSSKNKRWLPSEIIDKYETHKSLFENKYFDPKIEIHKAVTRITTEYANALKKNGNVRKAIPFLNKAISLVGEAAKEDSEEVNLYKFHAYELLKWNRGHSYFLTKNFDLALEDFESLALNIPENKSYKMWVRGAKLKKRRKLESILGVVFLLDVAFDFIFVKRTDSHIFKNVNLGVVIIIGAISWTMVIWNYIVAKKLEKYFESKL
jgi:tetratricopeptide (TPR) repeat protein